MHSLMHKHIDLSYICSFDLHSDNQNLDHILKNLSKYQSQIDGISWNIPTFNAGAIGQGGRGTMTQPQCTAELDKV